MTAQTEAATLTIERTMKAPAERIYRTFISQEAAPNFLAPPGCEFEVHEWDAKVGGRLHYSMSMPERGTQGFQGTFLELTEFTKIRHTYQFVTDDPDMGIEMEIRLTITEDGDTCRVVFEQFGLPKMIPPEGAKAGYEFEMDRLQKLVEQDAA